MVPYEGQSQQTWWKDPEVSIQETKPKNTGIAEEAEIKSKGMDTLFNEITAKNWTQVNWN